MKKLFFLLLFLGTVAPTLSAQNPAIREFIREHRKGADNVAFRVPGWLIGLAADVGEVAAEDEEEKLLFELAQQFGTIRLLTFNDGDFNAKADIAGLLDAIETHHGYERWASMRTQDGALVQLSVLQETRRKKRANEVSEIVVIITEPEEQQTFFAHFDTSITPEELGRVMNSLLAE